MQDKDLTTLIGQLKVFTENEEFSKVEENCKALIFNTQPNFEALGDSVEKVYLTALIKQEKYNDLVTFFEEYSESVAESKDPCSFIVFLLYSLYKLGKESQFEEQWEKYGSVDWIESEKPLSITQRHMLHIYAQFCLKYNKNDEAFRIYDYFIQHNDGSDNDIELACNKTAQQIYLPGLDPNFVVQTDCYDLLLNQSMVLVAKKQYFDALDLLEKAMDLAQLDFFEDDVRTIKLQLAYVHQLIGNNLESKELLNSLLENSNPTDPITLLTKNNLKSFQDLSKFKDNLPIILRELDQKAVISVLLPSLTTKQRSIISSNILFLRLFTNQKIKKSSLPISSTLKFYSKVVDNVNYVPYKTQAKLLYNKLQEILSNETVDKLLGQTIACIQLQIKGSNFSRAINVAEKYWNLLPKNDLPKSKRIISYILIQLYESTKRASSFSKHLKKLIAIFETKYLQVDPAFWKFVAFKLLSQGQTDDAKKILQEYSAQVPESRSVKYILDDTSVDMETVANIIDGVDVDSVLKAGISVFETNKRISLRVKPSSKNKRRVHKNKKLPSNCDSSKTPDPERWLPMKERSSYKVGKKQHSKDTQGAKTSRAAEAKLDITKKSLKKNAVKNKKKK